MDLKRIIISSLLIASVTSATSCDSKFWEKKSKNQQENLTAKQMVYAPELDPDVHELITDQSFKSLESDDELRFETAVTPEEAASETPVELLDDSGKTISKMYDDGTHSDRIAGDGIYTCSYQPKASGETSYSYKAKIGNFETEPSSVRYFDKITEQDVEDMNGVGEKFNEIQSKYLDKNGYVPEDKKEEAIEEIGEYAKELYNKGEAVEYRVNKDYDNVVVKLSSGITCVYSNPTEGYEAGTGADALRTAVNWAIGIALDDSHGYNKQNRDGDPDYDCSSLVIAAMKEGGMNVGGATYTGNMKTEFTNNDFTWIDWSTLGGVDNLQYGDVLLRSGHTELYIGNGERVGAHDNYDKVAGDGDGREINISACKSSEKWLGVLRYKEADPSAVGDYSGGGSSSGGSSGGGSSSTNGDYKVQNLTVKGFKPYNTSYPTIGENLQDTMDLITSEFSPNITSGGIITDSDVSPNNVESFGPNQVIFWRGHGGYDGNIHSFLCTTRPFNRSEYTDEDIVEDRILVEFTKSHYGKNMVCISSEYIDAHCPDMTDSFVFLGCCLGAKDAVLAASFINKNCNVVFGFSESVYSSYDNEVMYGLISEMCKKRTSNLTGYPVDYYSIDEALTTVKAIYGADDTVNHHGDASKVPAKPILFGNREYRFAEAIAGTNSNASNRAVLANGSLQLEKMYVSVKKGGSADIVIQSMPNGYKESDLIWTTDNEKVATVKGGKVTGVEAGHTSVSVVTPDGLYKQQCYVFVPES